MVNIHAAGTIPRTDLRLELMLATGSQDTSGNGRVVSSTGMAPSYEGDSTYGIPYAQFKGSGGLRLNTGWSTSVDNFTVSFWMKHSGVFITGSTILTGTTQEIYNPAYYPQYGITTFGSYHFDTYYSNIAQNILSSGEAGGIKFIIDAGGKCSIRGGSGIIQTVNQSIGYKYNAVGSAASGYRYDYKILETGTNMQETFNCSTLLDNKWHNVILASQTGSTSIYIDGVESTRLSGKTSIGRLLSIGSSDTNILTYSGKGISDQQLSTIIDSKLLRGNLSAFRVYSRALIDDEREALLEEFRYAQSDLSGASGISVSMERYTKPNLYVQFRNIPLSLSKENMIYEYSTDGQSFTPITNITDISSSTGSFDYRISIDLTNKSDGKLTITFRVRSGNDTFQNIGTVSFSKTDIITAITINVPSSTLESAKTITAQAPNAVLSLYVTTANICDASIGTGSFEDYYDITFTNVGDNGKRVCYKAYYPTLNKTIYKISGIIQGIQTTDIITNTPTTSLFLNYTFWTKSTYQKLSDATSFVLDLLSVSATASQGTINGMTMTDINGDGLVDFLYSRNDPIRRAIIINNGNFTFKTVYKCAIDGTSPNFTYYGDCADPTR